MFLHRKKGYRLSRLQKGCHLPNSPWAEIIKLFPARDSSVSDIPAVDGKIASLFYSVGCDHPGIAAEKTTNKENVEAEDLSQKISLRSAFI